MKDLIIARVDKARMLLSQARDAVDAKKVVDMAHAAAIYAKRQKLSQESIDYAQAVKVDAMTLMGIFLKAADKNKGARPGKTGSKTKPLLDTTPTLESLGISKKESSICQKLAEMAKKEPEKHAAIRNCQTPISSAFSSAHVSQNSGNSEWYTPEKFIKAAVRVMGGIDLDPASTEKANKVIGASKFFTKEQDGLSKEWFGRVWMNPPYSGELIGKFTSKLKREHEEERVTEAIALVNNATETAWFQEIGSWASGICFPNSRVKFWSPDGFSTAPLQGQAIIYLGRNQPEFVEAFEEFGLIVHVLTTISF